MINAILNTKDPNGRPARLDINLDIDHGVVKMRLLSDDCMSITNAIEHYAEEVASSFPMEPDKFMWLYVDSDNELNRVELDWGAQGQARNPRWRPILEMENRPWMKEIMNV
ncbi:MAG: hypothetical protein ABFE07_28995 [Armatimonadia bacterium]